MKTGFISDLHIDINSDYPVIDILAEEVIKEELKLLIVAGDISENPSYSIEQMHRLKDFIWEGFSCRLLYVPGNHDMWNKFCPDRDADDIYAEFCRDEICLSGKTVYIQDQGKNIAVLGDIGWYDYSFGDERYSRAEFDRMSLGDRTWQDSLFNSWSGDNAGRCRFFLEKLGKSIDECRQSYGEECSIMAVTHMLPIKEFCVPKEVPGWDYFNAFLGAETLGDLFIDKKVETVVCGHVHYRSSIVKKDARWICPCLGYHSEWPLYGLGSEDVREHIRDALFIIP